ncbi:MAG: FAD-binding protein, partial [Sandaracinaceae bacterium]|nr:FAD-binding protein [Sandaracinaceae bacterium]
MLGGALPVSAEEADVVVIGPGVAGLAAALAAKSRGAKVRVVGKLAGLSHLASGAWDEDPPHLRPLALIRRWDELRDAALSAVLDALGGYRPLSSAPLMQPLVATSWGILRRPLTAERLLLDLNSGKMRAIAVASLPHFNGLFARALARSLEEDAL